MKNEFVAAGIPSDEVDLMKALSLEEIAKCVKEGMKTPNKLDEAQYVEFIVMIIINCMPVHVEQEIMSRIQIHRNRHIRVQGFIFV